MLSSDGTRRLASAGVIDQIRPIPDADAIECATVRGWTVVVGKGEFHDGDRVLYIEPDAALPVADPRFASLAPRGVKHIDDVDYHMLKTIRLRGQVSQGIVYPAAKFPELDADDIDAALGIKLWEPPAPPVGANAIGPWNLPWLRRTDAERVQNLSDQWLQSVDDGCWVATEKIDGTSLTYALADDGTLHVYSRNLELKADPGTTPMLLADKLGLAAWMLEHGVDAVQGEMFGEGVQNNRLRVRGQQFATFAAWARVDGVAHGMFASLYGSDGLLGAVPVLDIPFPTTVAEALEQAYRHKSVVNPECLAEGIVWHHRGNASFPELDNRLVFKAVSAAYLIKHGL